MELHSKPSPKVQVYLLSRDRFGFCMRAIESILAQTFRDFELIVSENSIDECVASQIQAQYPTLKILRRDPTFKTPREHFEACIAEATSDYMVMFHDDDLMYPHFLENMVLEMERNPLASAVGCEARIMRGEHLTREVFMGSKRTDSVVVNNSMLAASYIALGLASPAPFPSYIYRTKYLAGMRFPYEWGEKYSDAAFLYLLSCRAPIVWTSKELMIYRIHTTNDSNFESITGRLKLYKFFYFRAPLGLSKFDLQYFRFVSWRKWLMGLRESNQEGTDRRVEGKHRSAVARRFVAFYLIGLLISRPIFYYRVLRAIKYRWLFKNRLSSHGS